MLLDAFTVYVSCCVLKSTQMTESSAETAPKAAKELLALDPNQESEFKSKVQEAKKKRKKRNTEEKPVKVGLHVWRGLEGEHVK